MQWNTTWKEGIARLARRQPFSGFMAWGIRLTVPRQRIGVALITFNAEGEVLLLRHVFRTRYPWGLPGGWLGRDESPAAGLRRELHEELGRDSELGPPALISLEGPPSHIVMAFLGHLRPGENRLNNEILEARWFAPDNLPRPALPFTERAVLAGLALARGEAVAVSGRAPMTWEGQPV